MRSRTSTTSSSTFVASPVYVDGSRLAQGLPIGSQSQIGAGMGLLRGLSGTSLQRGMMMVLGALVGGGKGAETERASCVSSRGLWKNSGLHARTVRTWKIGVFFRRGLVPDCFLYCVWVLPVGVRKFGFSGE